MNQLANFTTDELLAEIKRRLEGTGLKVQNVSTEVKYEYITGKVMSSSGDRYVIKVDEDCLDKMAGDSKPTYGVRPLTGVFSSKNYPKAGDKVKLKCRITKTCPKFSMFYARICEVIERR